MPHPLSHKYSISISQLCLENTDVPACAGAPSLDMTSKNILLKPMVIQSKYILLKPMVIQSKNILLKPMVIQSKHRLKPMFIQSKNILLKPVVIQSKHRLKSIVIQYKHLLSMKCYNQLYGMLSQGLGSGFRVRA